MRRRTTDRMAFAAMALLALCGAAGGAAMAGTASLPDDPLGSPMWRDMAAKFFDGAPVVLDPRIKVSVPSIVENQAQVPVTADARGIDGVVKLVVFADLNPIQHVLTLHPRQSAPYVSFRMKVEQGTPVRAAALTADGVWRVGGVFLDAAGGSCSAPAMARKDADWSQTVGLTQGRAWRQADGMSRVRLRIRHPMDTGLAKDNTPAFFIETLELKGGKGDGVARLELFEPVSEDPTLTLLLRLPVSEAGVGVEGRDNNGTLYRSTIPTSLDQSAIGSDTGTAVR